MSRLGGVATVLVYSVVGVAVAFLYGVSTIVEWVLAKVLNRFELAGK